ncbi:MAG TPA: SAM-dependent methyltransferase, partial [Trebonia sp.]|nr:SAM-dependent methyltransferase [Trebonia sp.]
VLAHARALLTSTPEGRTAYIQADLREPRAILSSPAVREVLDFSQPIALLLVAILHFIPDEDKPADIIATLLDALPSGSYLVASHVSMEHNPVMIGNAVRAYREAGLPAQARNSDEFARLAFGGLELVPPGVVLASEWRPEGSGPRPTPAEVNGYGGVARKPLRVIAPRHRVTGLKPGYVAPRQRLRKQSPELRGREPCELSCTKARSK